MALFKIQKLKVTIAASLAFIFISVSTIVLTIGVIFYKQDSLKVLNYAHAKCRIERYASKTHKCIFFLLAFSCYVPAWYVNYNRDYKAILEGTKRHQETSDALIEAEKYKRDLAYSCWYDTKNPMVAQWQKPSNRFAIILLSCGGLLASFCLISFFLMCLFAIQNKRRNVPATTPRVDVMFLK